MGVARLPARGGDSYLLADRVIARSLSVVAIVGIFWLVVRELPELGVLVAELLSLVTGTAYDADEVIPYGRARADTDTQGLLEDADD